jgi:hypothetical protein
MSTPLGLSIEDTLGASVGVIAPHRRDRLMLYRPYRGGQFVPSRSASQFLPCGPLRAGFFFPRMLLAMKSA